MQRIVPLTVKGVCRRTSTARAPNQAPLLGPEDEEAPHIDQPVHSKSEKEARLDLEAKQQEKEEWRTALAPTLVSISILWMLKMVQQVGALPPDSDNIGLNSLRSTRALLGQLHRALSLVRIQGTEEKCHGW